MYRLSIQNKPKIDHGASTHTSVKRDMKACMTLQYKVCVGTNPMNHNPFTAWLFQFFSVQDILVFRCVNKFGYNWCHLNLPVVKKIIGNELGINFQRIFHMKLSNTCIGDELKLMGGDFWDIHGHCPPGYHKKKGSYETFDITRLVTNGKAKFLEKHLYQVKLF